MSFTGQLGTFLSQLGDFVLGVGQTFDDAAELVGDSTLTASLVYTKGAIRANLSGESTLGVSGVNTDIGVYSLVGSSSIAATLKVDPSLRATLAGTSTFVANVTDTKAATATLIGDSSVASVLSLGKETVATLEGTSTFTATLSRSLKTFVYLYGDSTLTAPLKVSYAVNSTLIGSSTFTPNATLRWGVGATLPGEATISHPYLFNWDEFDASLQADSSLNPSAQVHYTASTLSAGTSAFQASLGVTWGGFVTLVGESTLDASLTAVNQLTATLVGDSYITGDVASRIEADLLGGSTFTPQEFGLIRCYQVQLFGDSEVDASLNWTGHAPQQELKPTVNSAATLQQFIDALGVGDEESKTPTRGNLTIINR